MNLASMGTAAGARRSRSSTRWMRGAAAAAVMLVAACSAESPSESVGSEPRNTAPAVTSGPTVEAVSAALPETVPETVPAERVPSDSLGAEQRDEASTSASDTSPAAASDASSEASPEPRPADEEPAASISPEQQDPAVVAPAAEDLSPVAGVLMLLDGLTVAAESGDGYDRGLFRHWVDADGDGCDARRETLIAEAVAAPSVGSGCSLSGGVWLSVYDGKTETGSGSGFDVDHMVPLKEAWESGANSWPAARRERFANDLGYQDSLVAVSASSNRSKGARDPAEWLPPETSAHCWYAVAWVTVKSRWGLTVDRAEASALYRVLAGCDGSDLSDSSASAETEAVAEPEPENEDETGTAADAGPDPEPADEADEEADDESESGDDQHEDTGNDPDDDSAGEATEPPAGTCHPAYEPCLPNLPGDALNCGDLASDQKPVTVKEPGVDPYRLDRDGDGEGCAG